MKSVNRPDQLTQPEQLTQPLNHSLRLWFKVGVLVSVFIFAYFEALSSLISTWRGRDDYSHGFLVPFIALYFVWAEREKLKSIPENLISLVGLY